MDAENPYSLPVQDLRARLVSAAGKDGGWGYYSGHTGRLEPSAWAMMALAATHPVADASRDKPYLSFIGRLQRADGLLVEIPSAGPNFAFNGLTLLALHALPALDNASLSASLVSGLLTAKGIRLVQEAQAAVQQNYTLQAWSWVEGTFSWVEPTAWCLLALKKAGARSETAKARIAEAEAVLIDRVCKGGGWNYGNSNALGQGLAPYVPTTALALLAMQDQPAHPDVVRSLTWLEAHATAELSAMALGLTAICLQVFSRPVDKILATLAAQRTKTSFMENTHLSAIALYALSIEQHRAAAFRL